MSTPQFQKAEYAGSGGGERCKICGAALGPAYWRVGTHMTCQACAEKAKSALPQDSHSAFTRGVLFGVGGAIIGLILYATFTIITGIYLGYVALAVGYIVGKSIRMGSNNMAGRRYQIAAVILTYAAVSMAAIPIGISQVVKEHRAQVASQARQTIPPDDNNPTNIRPPAAIPSPEANALPPRSAQPRPAPEPVNWSRLVVSLVFVGLASPFLDLAQNGFGGIIGLVILLVGIRIAWQITGAPRIPPVSGPFRNTSATAVPVTPPPAAPPPLG
jgi:hypothetical protein